MTPVKVRKIGNSLGIVLSKELLGQLRVGLGDELFVCEAKDGIRLSGYDPEFGAQMEAAQAVMKKRRNMLRKLAE